MPARNPTGQAPTSRRGDDDDGTPVLLVPDPSPAPAPAPGPAAAPTPTAAPATPDLDPKALKAAAVLLPFDGEARLGALTDGSLDQLPAPARTANNGEAARLRLYPSVLDAVASLPPRPRGIWLDVASTKPGDITRLSSRFGLKAETIRRTSNATSNDALRLYDTYLELRLDLAMDEVEEGQDLVTFLIFGSTLVSVHKPDCVHVRHIMVQAALGGAPGSASAPASATALPVAGAGAGVDTDGSKLPPLLWASVSSPFQAVCEVLNRFSRDCGVVTMRQDEAVEALHQLMPVLPENERSDYLLRLRTHRADLIAFQRRLRMKRTTLRRLLVGRASLLVPPDLQTHLRFIFDQINACITAMASAKDSVDQVEANYLAKVSVDLADVAQRTNSNVKFFAVIATLSLPINIVSGIMGMNVWYPGRIEETETSLDDFIISLAVIVGMIGLMALVMWLRGML